MGKDGNGDTYRGTAHPCYPKVKILSLLTNTEGLDLWMAGWYWRRRCVGDGASPIFLFRLFTVLFSLNNILRTKVLLLGFRW